MKTCIVQLESTSPYSPSRAHEAPRANAKEAHDDYDERTWREHAHYDPKTRRVYIPATAFKQALQSASKYVGARIKGKGMKTWAEKFRSGIIVENNLTLRQSIDEIPSERVHCHANGVRGSGKRVYRRFPVVPEWSGEVTFIILDDEITEEVFVSTLKQAGVFIGMGRWRAENGGQNGRFSVVGYAWEEKTF